MGTHISRIKSVDLDAWTDEQLQSILSWGNARANKYWEAKLSPGHVPSEAKIENFIRTKYELKRWVMDGPMPDPASLDVEADDDIPLSLVKEKKSVERRESLRKSSVGRTAAPKAPAPASSSAVGDLLGADDIPARNTGSAPPVSRAPPPPPRAEAMPPKATAKATATVTTKDSLLGLDFLGGGESAAPPRPASTTNSQSRPDLKQSILSLYASAPRPQAQSSAFLGGTASPTPKHHQQNSVGGLGDAFGSLSFSSTNTSIAPTSPPPPAPDPFATFGTRQGASKTTPKTSTFGGLSGGGFFDAKPAAAAAAAPPSHQKISSKSSVDPSASFATSAAPKLAAALAPTSSSSYGLGDLFDFPASAAPPATAAVLPSSQPTTTQTLTTSANSVFNLSTNIAKSPATTAKTTKTTAAMGDIAMSSADIWGGNEWSTPSEPAAAKNPVTARAKSSAASKPTTADFGWSSGGLANTPIVPGASGGFTTASKAAQDEEFGVWAGGTGTGVGSGTKTTAGRGGREGGSFVGNDEDLFSNVWQ